MQSKASTVEQYLAELPPERQGALRRLRDTIAAQLPPGFEERMGYGMPGWSVPHSLYPAGYHCDPKTPLPFLGLASQKQYISVYHMGLYAETGLLAWFVAEHAKASPHRLDMGKCCVRYKKPEHIPFELIARLAARMTPQQWIAHYEASRGAEAAARLAPKAASKAAPKRAAAATAPAGKSPAKKPPAKVAPARKTAPRSASRQPG